MKKSRFFIIAAILISSMITGIAHAYAAPGSSSCFLINPPNSSKDWTFGGGQYVRVYLENLNILPATVTLTYYFTNERYWHTIIPPKSMVGPETYSVFGYTPIQYRFSLSTASGAASIVAHAEWN